MPWYWTDDVALVLVAKGRIDSSIGETLRQLPVAYSHRARDDRGCRRAVVG